MIRQALVAGREYLLESEAKQVLSACGVAVPASVVADTAAELRDRAAGLRFPVVLKLQSADIAHKSEVGAVRVGIADPDALERAAAEMLDAVRSRMPTARIAGLLAEEMAPPGVELIVGLAHDETFGALLVLGIGGVLTEVYQDVAFRAVPVLRADVESMLDELQAAPLLRGFRHIPAPDRTALVDSVLAIGGSGGVLDTWGDRLREFECNPLVASPAGVMVLDAKIRLAK